ncbi:Polysaccharide deacetylase [Elusimicrobium minutum Pei191]|uniref:Polysaccharide deacetylase n=1 Tax=Elusimicrobium minutum (strain Pei191) TaxID=445932 RepID=B2KE53_ELUMP|nr:polysaccharide deacetylase family protein [Elusimicrobium minutum]ACC98799.1 Polysaccharide deacetylase [Elusimicrobium minutum Pei191]
MILFLFLTAFTLLLLIIISYLLWWIPRPKLVALMYHHIGPVTNEEEKDFFIEAKTFEQHLSLIREKGFNFVSIEDIETHQATKSYLPYKPVVITLDDGWEDNYTYAFPILKKLGVKANIFLSVSQIGTPGMLNWEQVKEMNESGLVSFGSHGLTHKRLRSLTSENVSYEMQNSKKILEEKLGKKVLSFCYPFGAFDKRIRYLCFKAGYIIDYGTRKGVNVMPWNGRHPLQRAHVMRNNSLRHLKTQLIFGREKI